MSDPIPVPLTVQSLHVSYRAPRKGLVEAVRGVDLTVAEGEFVALVGESGSGKSTTAAAITGLLPADATVDGLVRLSGSSVVGLSERRLSRLRGRAVGLIPQDPGASLNPVLTIGAQVDEVFAVRGEKLSRTQRRARAIELLETAEVTHASERLGQFPHELSGGLKQRILIAIAFGLNPRLIVADEPTSALDVTVQKQVLRVFNHLAVEHGTSVLFVTHDIALATDHADRIVVMRRGKIVEDGATEAIVAGASDEYARGLISHARSTERSAPPARLDAAEVVRVDGLHKAFPPRRGVEERHAVRDVSFTLRSGQTLALVGESGSGKTTTARMLLRLVDPTTGTIRVHNRDVSDVRGSARRDLWRAVQLVYQNPDSALNPHWRVKDIVAEPLRGRESRTTIRQRVAELLDAVSLPAAAAQRRPSELSGGQRQRVAIARALAPRSSVVVLDEALSALDVITQEQVLSVLGQLQRDLDLAYLFISHDLSIVRRIAHDIVVMRDGGIVEAGETEQLFRNPQTEYLRELIAAIPGSRHLHSVRETAVPSHASEVGVPA